MPAPPCPTCGSVHRDVPCALTLDPTRIANAVLRRLVAEVQWDHVDSAAYQKVYDRAHTRHNRGQGGRLPYPPEPPPRPLPTEDNDDA